MQFRAFQNPSQKNRGRHFLACALTVDNSFLTMPFLKLRSPRLIHGKGLQAQHKIKWTLEAEQSFTELKLSLQSTPTLGLPDPTRPFTQTVDDFWFVAGAWT